AGQLPIGADPHAQRLVRVVAGERLEEIGLIVEEPVLEMNREGYRVNEKPPRPGEIVHRLEDVVLVENVLGRSVIRDQAVAGAMLLGDRIEIQVEDDRAHPTIDVDTTRGKT